MTHNSIASIAPQAPDQAQVLHALDTLANKRRTRPRLQRARLLLAQLASWQTSQNAEYIENVAFHLDLAGEAMANLEGAATSAQKQVWRDEADSDWAEVAEAVGLLADALFFGDAAA